MSQLWVTDDVRTDLAPFLSALILARVNEKSKTSRNIGGWKSGYDFFDWPSAKIKALRDELSIRLGAIPTGWAMVNRSGSFHERHEHDPTFTCGVYYVQAGDPVVPTIFEEAANGMTIIHHIEPKPGRLVTFPGWMTHSVPVYAGTEPRISIAFEIRP